MTLALPHATTSLRHLAVGETGVLHHVGKHVDSDAVSRLAHLGIRPGATLTVRQRTAGRGFVVKAGMSTYCLDAATAAALVVERAEPRP